MSLSCFSQAVSQLQVVAANSALRLKAVLDFEDKLLKFTKADKWLTSVLDMKEEDRKTRRVAGDEWLFEGPRKLITCACNEYLLHVCISSWASSLTSLHNGEDLIVPRAEQRHTVTVLSVHLSFKH